MSILLIHCRRGLFSLTLCPDCGYTWDCQNCSAKLTTYESESLKRLICHQCQSSYNYPRKCPNCGLTNILSKFGGIEELVRILAADFGYMPIRYDGRADQIGPVGSNSVAVSTRLYDPGIDYGLFDYIIFLQAENLFANSDYLTGEEVYKSLAEVFLAAKDQAEIVFDTRHRDLDFFQSLVALDQQLNLSLSSDVLAKNLAVPDIEPKLAKITQLPKTGTTELINSEILIQKKQSIKQPQVEIQNLEKNDRENLKNQEVSQESDPAKKPSLTLSKVEIIQAWYTDLMIKESTNRQNFRFPPFTNLLLLTTQEKSSADSLESLSAVTNYLATLQQELPEISFGRPYEAKFFKRKGKFSHHLLVRYPRQYPKFARLKTITQWLADKYKLQIRLNPRHLF